MARKNNLVFVAVGAVILAIGAGYYFTNTAPENSPPALQESYLETSTLAQPSPTPTPTPTPTPATLTQTKTNQHHMITLQTSLGNITFETFDADAPKAVENFVTLAQKGFYDNVIFHRVIAGFMIQGGDPTGTGRGGPGYSFADELNPATPSYQAGYQRGVVAMANAGPNTNGSQFFIMLKDTPLPHAYTIFGKVTAGQDVVDAIGALETGANDRPVTPPVIQKVTVTVN
jgi:cyclophilin family peptidyl-prolyl cis-trans isomerase